MQSKVSELQSKLNMFYYVEIMSISLQGCMLSHFSRVWLFEVLCTVSRQAPLSLGFSRQEYWSGLPGPPQGIVLTQGLNPGLLCLLHWQADSLSGSLSLPPLLQEQCIKFHLDFIFLSATGQRASEGEGLGVTSGGSIQFSPPCPYLFGIGSLSFDFDPPSHLS